MGTWIFSEPPSPWVNHMFSFVFFKIRVFSLCKANILPVHIYEYKSCVLLYLLTLQIHFTQIVLILQSIETNRKHTPMYHPIPQGSLTFVEKPYRKAQPHSEEVQWWRTFMVE